MKNVKLIDLLPTLFGIMAVAGALIPALWTEINLGPLFLLGGIPLTLVTSVASVIIASREKKFGALPIVNGVWALLSGAGVYLVLHALSHPLRFTF